MKKKLHVGASPLTGTIYAGTLLKDGMTWAADRQDVTMEDADYFDFETAVATQEFRKQMLAEIMADWAAELMESMEQLDAHPELRVRANCNSAAIRSAEGF